MYCLNTKMRRGSTCSCCIVSNWTLCLPAHSRTDSFSPNDLRQKWCWLWRQGQTGNMCAFRQTHFLDHQHIFLDIGTLIASRGNLNLTLCFCFAHSQLIEVTGKTQDECMVALHDCNEDVNRAINFLLESTSDIVSLRTHAHTIFLYTISFLVTILLSFGKN